MPTRTSATSWLAKYFRFTLDHKVVGLSTFGMLIYFFNGGPLAIGTRTELLSPNYHVMSLNHVPARWSANTAP